MCRIVRTGKQAAEWFLSGGNQASPDTNPDGKQLFAILGDSIARGTSDGVGPTPTAGTVFEWDGAAEVEVTNSDLIDANTGSMWPRFGIDHNTNTGRKPVFINTAAGGAEYSPNGDNNNWSSTGTLRAAALTKINSAMSHYAVTKLKGIFVILGVNDARGAVALATIQSDISDFYTWLQTQYPDTPILIAQIGRTESVTAAVRINTIRGYVRSIVEANTNCHFFCNLTSLVSGGYYDTDNLHLAQTGNNMVGQMAARWFSNSAYSKWARSIIASFTDDLSTARKTLISNFVGADPTTFFLSLDVFLLFKNTNEDNCYNDWLFGAGPLKVNTLIFTANQDLAAAGGGYVRSGYISSVALKSTLEDVIFGCRCTSKTVGSMTIIGSVNASSTSDRRLATTLTGPNRSYRVHDTTGTSVTGDMAAGSNYHQRRTSGNVKQMIRNTTVDSNVSVAVAVAVTVEDYIFALNTNGSSGSFATAGLGCYYNGKDSVIQSQIDAKINALLDGW